MKKSNCEFVTVWDGGIAIRTQAFFDEQTGEVYSLESVDADVEVLEKEFIEFPNEDTKDVCQTCHSFVLKPYMRPQGKILIDDTQCSDPGCSSHD
jgi:hypothetical protein